MRNTLLAGATALATVLFAGSAMATDFSFSGFLDADDDVQFFNFQVGTTSNVTLLTYSYAGGTQADGNLIIEGGFDPILALFDSSGTLINSNDDGSASDVGTSAVTGSTFDTFLTATLGAGTYTVAVMQYDNFPSGSSLSDGFTYSGQPNFTAGYGCSNGQFCDVDGFNRSAFWAFDVLNVDDAVVVDPSPVPLPAGMPLLLGALGAMGIARRRKKT